MLGGALANHENLVLPLRVVIVVATIIIAVCKADPVKLYTLTIIPTVYNTSPIPDMTCASHSNRKLGFCWRVVKDINYFFAKGKDRLDVLINH